MTSPPSHENQARSVWPSSIARQWSQAQQAHGFARIFKLGLLGLELVIVVAVVAGFIWL
jgi:hypothetical protein